MTENIIEKKLKDLPRKSGVYIMKNKDGNIIYIGKAVVLKNRVTQYFRKNKKSRRIEKMVSQISDFEYIVTDTEDEALILECNLIKKNKPRFNILLKDDKTYPYIKIEKKKNHPKISITRNIKKMPNVKYYGPFPSVYSLKEAIKYIKDIAMQITQKPFIDEGLTEEEAQLVENEIKRVLSGNISKDLRKLEEEMEAAAENLEFEKAIEIREKINGLKRLAQKQKISNLTYKSIDAIGIYRNEIETHIMVFEVREGKLEGKKNYVLKNVEHIETENIIETYIMQTYVYPEISEIPGKIMIKQHLERKETLEKILSNKAGKKIEIVVPQRGEKLKFVDLAEENAKILLENKTRNEESFLLELKETLKMKTIPRRIEMYDISNTSGSKQVAGMVVMTNGRLDRKASRNFKVKENGGQDDYSAMKEIIQRRILHTVQGKKGLGEIPDLIIVDGGKGQISKVKEIFEEIQEIPEITIAGLVKNDKHRTKNMLNENFEELKLSSKTFTILSNLQEEVHRKAIDYHIKKRDEEIIKSELDRIKGIGEVKKKNLLKKFKTIEKIEKASKEELLQTDGISLKDVENIVEYFKINRISG